MSSSVVEAATPTPPLNCAPAAATGRSHVLNALDGLWADAPRKREAFTVVLCDGARSARETDSDGFGGSVPRLVERINRRFGTAQCQPVVFHSERLTDGERYALYRDAAVGVDSSVHESGISETAEFVASQSADPSVLLLSRWTETNNRLHQGALNFSPFDGRSFLDRLDEAIHLGPEERRRRLSKLNRLVRGYDEEARLQHVEGTVQGIEERHSTTCSST